MSHWRVDICGKGVRRAVVEKLVGAMRDKFDSYVTISVIDNSPPESRADRFQAALDLVSEARGAVESLRDELQEWYDNLPEGFQQGDKGEALQSAIDELEEHMTSMEDLESASVEFPGMY